MLNQPVFNRKAIVSVGFANGEEMNSELTPDKNTGKKDQQFYLTVIPKFRTAFGLIVILGALIALSRTGPAHPYYSRCGRATPAGWSEALQPGTRTDGVLVFSRDRLLFLSLDRHRRHGYA